MLRDFVYTPNPSLIRDALNQFDVSIPEEKGRLALIEFQILTPDSFVWRFLMGGVVYYMYAEDYIEGLEDVYRKMSTYAIGDIKLDFIKAKQQKEFDHTEPAKSAATYEEPENYDEMRPFAVGSGYDFVFLCKSSENAGNALFNS